LAGTHIEVGFTPATIQEQGDRHPPAVLISIRTQSIIPLEWRDDLTGILSRSTGYDHLRFYLDGCGKSIPCGYLPLYCNRSVAEQAMMLWMALLRKLPQQLAHFHRFRRDGLTGRECRGKVLLIVGVGHIGSEIAWIGQGLGMEVYGVDIEEKHNHVQYLAINEGLALADIIVCAMNLTEENQGFFSYERLRAAKRGLIFVNVARGKLSPAAGLLPLLQEGCLSGIAMDVFNHESELAVSLREGLVSSDPEVPATLELANHPQAILTPHNAFNTREAVERKASHSIEQIAYFLQHGYFLWPIPRILTGHGSDELKSMYPCVSGRQCNQT
jgi:D-lactate dehydrogenase